MNKKSRPYAILIFGVPGSGKTTFAEKFSTQFKAPYINIDALKTDHKIDRTASLIIIDQVAKCGQPLVIEGGLDTEKDREEIRQTLKQRRYKPVLIWIQTDIPTIKKRLSKKLASAEKAKTYFSKAIKKLEAPADLEWPIVISGKHTFAGQLKIVLAALSK
jgi:predicted kinase